MRYLYRHMLIATYNDPFEQELQIKRVRFELQHCHDSRSKADLRPFTKSQWLSHFIGRALHQIACQSGFPNGQSIRSLSFVNGFDRLSDQSTEIGSWNSDIQNFWVRSDGAEEYGSASKPRKSFSSVWIYRRVSAYEVTSFGTSLKWRLS